MAVVSVNKNKIRRLAEQGNKNAALIERLMEDSTVFLSTIQVAITLAGFFSSASAATGIAQVYGGAVKRLGNSLQSVDCADRSNHYPGLLYSGFWRISSKRVALQKGRRIQPLLCAPNLLHF